MGTGITRREFVGATTAGLAAMAASGQMAAENSIAGGLALPSFTKARVLRVFIGMHPAWPKPDLKIEDEVKHLQTGIDKVAGAEDIDFVSNMFIKDTNTLGQLLAQHKDVDGILAVQTCMGTSAMLSMMADSGIPTISFNTPYSAFA